MAGNTTSALLETAGIAPKQYGMAISVAAQNRSVMFNKVRRWMFEPGQEFYIPKMNARTVTAGATQADADLTFTALAGTKSTMTNTWAYDGYSIQEQGMSAMSPERLRMNLEAVIDSAGQALANQIDADLLGQYASYTGTTVAAAAGASAAFLREAIGNQRIANAPLSESGGYFIVLYEDEWENLDTALAAVNQSRVDVDFPNDDSTGDFIYRKTMISTTGNVPLATNRRGVCFSGEAMALAIRSMVEIRDEYDIRDGTRKLLLFSDYAYDLPRPEWALEFTGGTS